MVVSPPPLPYGNFFIKATTYFHSPKYVVCVPCGHSSGPLIHINIFLSRTHRHTAGYGISRTRLRQEQSQLDGRGSAEQEWAKVLPRGRAIGGALGGGGGYAFKSAAAAHTSPSCCVLAPSTSSGRRYPRYCRRRNQNTPVFQRPPDRHTCLRGSTHRKKAMAMAIAKHTGSGRRYPWYCRRRNQNTPVFQRPPDRHTCLRGSTHRKKAMAMAKHNRHEELRSKTPRISSAFFSSRTSSSTYVGLCRIYPPSACTCFCH